MEHQLYWGYAKPTAQRARQEQMIRRANREKRAGISKYLYAACTEIHGGGATQCEQLKPGNDVEDLSNAFLRGMHEQGTIGARAVPQVSGEFEFTHGNVHTIVDGYLQAKYYSYAEQYAMDKQEALKRKMREVRDEREAAKRMPPSVLMHEYAFLRHTYAPLLAQYAGAPGDGARIRHGNAHMVPHNEGGHIIMESSNVQRSRSNTIGEYADGSRRPMLSPIDQRESVVKRTPVGPPGFRVQPEMRPHLKH